VPGHYLKYSPGAIWRKSPGLVGFGLQQSQICNDKDSCRWANNSRKGFKVIVSSQQVIYWDEKEISKLGKVSTCVIRDRENWRCHKNSGEIIGFIDGDWIGVLTDPLKIGGEFKQVWIVTWWFEAARELLD